MKYLLISLTVLIFACGSKEFKPLNLHELKSKPLDHAKLFEIREWEDTTVVSVYSGTDSNKTVTNILSHDGNIRLENQEWVPLENCILISATQFGALSILNLRDKIGGVNKKSYVYDSLIRSSIDSKEILEYGELFQINKELLLKNKCKVIFYSGGLMQNTEETWFKNHGITLIPVIEWQESHVLARAEWIKFYAALFDKEEESEKHFTAVKNAYMEIASKSKSCEGEVLIGNDYKGVWYTPGGKSYLAQMLRSTGIDYPWYDTDKTGSLSFDLEVMIKEQQDANYWINPGTATSLSQLKSENQHYSQFQAFQNKRVFNYTKRSREDGANEYWETGLYFPNILLSDYRLILQGDSSMWKDLYYYQQLQ